VTTAKISSAARPLPGPTRSWRGALLIGAAVLLATLIGAHRLIPNIRGFGSMIDSVAPLFGLAIPVLAVAALIRRSPRALVAVLIPALIWAVLYGPAWLPKGGGEAQLRVASQNLYAENPDPAGTVAALAADADLIALQEGAGGTLEAAAQRLAGSHPHHASKSTVSLLSRFPIKTFAGVDTGFGWTRALRAVVAAPGGDVAVYVVHLGSARINETATRDHTIAMLTDAIRADSAARVVVLGDLNTATTDRAMAPLTDLLDDAQADAGWGFGFTWPSSLPIMRPDHVLYRGLTATDAKVVRTPGTDHRAVTAAFTFGTPT
jgi:vancomycin resistance protein VanJ